LLNAVEETGKAITEKRTYKAANLFKIANAQQEAKI